MKTILFSKGGYVLRVLLIAGSTYAFAAHPGQENMESANALTKPRLAENNVPHHDGLTA